MTEIEKYVKEMKEAAGVIFDHGWAEAYAGNMSVCINEKTDFDRSGKIQLHKKFSNLKGRSVLITSSGSRMRQIASQDQIKMFSLIKIDENGEFYYCHPDFSDRPSSEITAHLMIHNEFCKMKKSDTAIVHCHPDSIITLLRTQKFEDADSLNGMLSDVLLESKLLLPNGAGVLDEMEPGSDMLANAICREVIERDIVLLDKHGCFSYGRDIDEALDKIEFVDKAARINLELFKLKYKDS